MKPNQTSREHRLQRALTYPKSWRIYFFAIAVLFISVEIKLSMNSVREDTTWHVQFMRLYHSPHHQSDFHPAPVAIVWQGAELAELAIHLLPIQVQPAPEQHSIPIYRSLRSPPSFTL